MVMGVSSFWSLSLKVHTQNGRNLKQQGIILSYRWVWVKLGCLWWSRRVKKWRKQSCQCQESVFERRLAHHPKFSAPQIAVFSWTRSLLSYCIPFGCDGGLPLPVCKTLAARALYWSSTAWWQQYEWWTVLVISPCDFVKNRDLLQLDKNRFLSTAYLQNKCKHYT